jgi:hypothetical protein
MLLSGKGEEVNLSIGVFSSLILGQHYVTHLSARVNAWRHSIRAVGGYWDGAFSIRGGSLEMEDWVQNGLGRHIEVKDEALAIVWEGFVNKVTITAGPLSIVIGPLMEAYNRVAVTYSTISEGEFGTRETTDRVDNVDAQEKYGIIEKRVSLSGSNTFQAEAIRDTFLEENAWPRVSHDLAAVGHEPNIVVECLGYVRWLESTIYEQTAETGDILLHDKVKSVILAEPNGFFELGDTSVSTELLSNGTFDAAGAGGADIWGSWTESAGDGSLANVTTDHKFGGNCAKLTAGPTFNTHVYQDVTVTAETACRLTLWARSLDSIQYTGTHDGGNDVAYLRDSGADFWGDDMSSSLVWRGARVQNTTDGSEGRVTDTFWNGTAIRVDLTGGTDNDWDNADAYIVDGRSYPARFGVYDNDNGAWIRGVARVGYNADTSWHKFDYIFYVPTDCTSIRIYLYCAETDAKQVHVDGISVREYSAAMEATGVSVPAYEEGKAAWSVVKELASYGDYQDNRYNWGVYAGRRVVLETIPDDFEYTMSALNTGAGYRTVEGGQVKDWNVLPGKWLLVTDILTGLTEASLRRNPKAMFIEEMRYSAEQGLTINPVQASKVKQAIAKLGLLERE